MNERIRELSQLAWTKTSEAVPFYDSTGNISRDFNLKYQQEFAVLIVKECAAIAAEQGDTAEHSFTATRAKWFRLGAIKSATMIKRTFGVEL